MFTLWQTQLQLAWLLVGATIENTTTAAAAPGAAGSDVDVDVDADDDDDENNALDINIETIACNVVVAALTGAQIVMFLMFLISQKPQEQLTVQQAGGNPAQKRISNVGIYKVCVRGHNIYFCWNITRIFLHNSENPEKRTSRRLYLGILKLFTLSLKP